MLSGQQAFKVRLLDPIVEAMPPAVTAAARLLTLDGKVIAFLDNGKPNAGRLLELIEGLIHERYQISGSVHVRKPDTSRVATEALLDDLAERCDAVVTALGD